MKNLSNKNISHHFKIQNPIWIVVTDGTMSMSTQKTLTNLNRYHILYMYSYGNVYLEMLIHFYTYFTQIDSSDEDIPLSLTLIWLENKYQFSTTRSSFFLHFSLHTRHKTLRLTYFQMHSPDVFGPYLLYRTFVFRTNNVDRTFNGFSHVVKDQIENKLSNSSMDLMAYLCSSSHRLNAAKANWLQLQWNNKSQQICQMLHEILDLYVAMIHTHYTCFHDDA